MLTRQPELTYSEYLAYEHTSPEKHEFFHGRAYAIQSLGMGDSVQLQSIDLATPLSAIYEDVEL